MPIMTEPGEITPKSALRYRPIDTAAQTIPVARTRRSRLPSKHLPHTTGGPPFVKGRYWHLARVHWLAPAGLAMVVTVLLIWLVQVGLENAMHLADDLRYGYPRTTQLDAFVGHERGAYPSHFLAINLRGKVQIIELPGGEASQARIYAGPQLVGEHVDLAPVQLAFVKRDGKPVPDMKVTCSGIAVWFRNEQGRFVPQ